MPTSSKMLFRGERCSVRRIAQIVGVSKNTLTYYLDKGLTPTQAAEAATEATGKRKTYRIRGKTMSVTDAARMFGAKSTTIRRRLKDGMSINEALTSARQAAADERRGKRLYGRAERPERGDVFGRLTVLGAKRDDHNVVVCRCKCGKIARSLVWNLTNGHVRSCGCYRSEASRNRIVAQNTTHGMTDHPLFLVYKNMIGRCLNDRHPQYDAYGERGIDVCRSWRSSKEAFFRWALDEAEEPWQPGLWLDRVDNDRGYGPRNCRFTTPKESGNNVRKNKHYWIDGRWLNAQEIADERGVARSRIVRVLQDRGVRPHRGGRGHLK